MANIQEYLPEIEGQGPVGAVSPNLELAGAVGNAISNVGRATEQIAEVMAHRESQKESTQAYATFSKARADHYGIVNKSIQDGDLDEAKGQQIMKSYQDFVESQADRYGTAVGKNYFDRQAARLGSSLQQKVSAGVAHVAGKIEAQSIDEAQGDDKLAILQDPDQFADILQAHNELLDMKSSVNGGPLSALQVLKAKKASAAEYSFTAIRALSQMSPEMAQQSLNSGYFTRHLNDKQMNEAERIVSQARTASEVQARLTAKHDSDEQGARDDETMRGFLKDIHKGRLDLRKVLNSELSFSDQQKVINAQEANTRRNREVDPRAVQRVMKRIVSGDNEEGHISSNDQLMQMMASGEIQPATAMVASTWLGKDPETKNLNVARKRVLGMASQELGRSAGIPGIVGLPLQKDPDGDYKIMLWQNAVHEKEKEQVAKGLPVSDLYNPLKPEFVGHMIKDFQMTHAEVTARQAHTKTQEALGIAPQAPTVIDNTPGVPIPTPTPSTTPPKNDRVRKPGESAADYIKRVNGG